MRCELLDIELAALQDHIGSINRTLVEIRKLGEQQAVVQRDLQLAWASIYRRWHIETDQQDECIIPPFFTNGRQAVTIEGKTITWGDEVSGQ